MNARIFSVTTLAAVLIASATAQPTNPSQWVGVWQSTLDGQPGATLTLADDTGQLGGTLVLNVILKDDGQPRIAASEPHLLLNLNRNGSNLSFDVKKIDGSAGLLHFALTLTSGGMARIHCMNCGAGAPTVEMDRLW